MDSKLNIIVIGKSGVGKSSLLNYVTGSDVFDTGVGEPVTKEYFQSVTHTDTNGIVYQLHDTKGLEPNNLSDAIETIKAKIAKMDECKSMFDWIHSIYYCFSAATKRIEHKEIEFINELSKCCNVVIVLTKSDQVDIGIIEQLKQSIRDGVVSNVRIIPACSVSIETRKGSSKQFGKDEMLKYGFYGLWEKIIMKIGNVLNSYQPFNEIKQVKGSASVDAIRQFEKAINSFKSNKLDFQKILSEDLLAIEKAGKFYSSIHNVEIPHFDNLYSKRIIAELYSELNQKFIEAEEKIKSRSYSFLDAFGDIIKFFLPHISKIELTARNYEYQAECRFLRALYFNKVEALRDALRAEMYMYGNIVFKQTE